MCVIFSLCLLNYFLSLSPFLFLSLSLSLSLSLEASCVSGPEWGKRGRDELYLTWVTVAGKDNSFIWFHCCKRLCITPQVDKSFPPTHSSGERERERERKWGKKEEGFDTSSNDTPSHMWERNRDEKKRTTPANPKAWTLRLCHCSYYSSTFNFTIPNVLCQLR